MESFECAICLKLFNEPVVISCGHTFCKSCLKQLKQNQLKCPLCQYSFTSVDSLPVNFVVLQWMEENKSAHIRETVLRCDECDEDKVAWFWCERCEVHFCKECDLRNHSGKSSRGHVRIGIKEKMRRCVFSKCSKHSRDNEVFCLDCDSLMCALCVIDYHQQHKVSSVNKCAEEKRIGLRTFVEPFRNLDPLLKIEKEVELTKEKDAEELRNIILRMQVLERNMIEHNVKLQKITTQKQKIKTSEVVLMNAIQEMRDMDLMNNQNIETMKEKIQKVLQDVYPEGDKKRLELEKIEKEKIEKERLAKSEKERLAKLEKERWEQLQWEFYKNGTVSSKTFTTSQNGGWVVSSLLSGNNEISLLVNCVATESYGWFQVGIGTDKEFKNPGYNSPDIPFCYHGYHGKVNNNGDFVKWENSKAMISIVLTIQSNRISFSVNGSKQNGSWEIPPQYRLIIEVYHPPTSIQLQQCKPIY